ncbi:U32 family peptidase [uncultured Enorma sp.]|uniref:U32 family peptidase n=1 Tax=uncultured Enorma sp. TaxID=1714346 RepID=UPI0028054E58|nr:U32 family peptidase [uncultured Enorma sp.]
MPDRSPELLAPAGGPAPFAAALAAGADAIYMGMGAFNARRKAENFTDEAFEAACRTAHLAGARVYVTINIVIKDREMTGALELVRRCARLGADAFIIQDWGLFAEVRRLMPGIETHISTQANIHDARGVAWCKAMGADRVTLSRELSINEIAAIHEACPSIDLEVFAHGSICFSYSGICLLSSFCQAGRSANRGMCAQPCRLPYELLDENGRVISAPGRGRPLCPRDTCTTDLLPRLVDAGAAALKLEGRMKAADYVYAVTDVYRRELDDVLAGREPKRDERAVRARQLKRCFNRDFTHAYQDGRSDDDMMSYERSNNRGEIVGRVADFRAHEPLTKGERMRAQIKGPAGVASLALDAPVGTGDLLELRDDADPDTFLTTLARRDAAAGEILDVDVPRPVVTGWRVRVIRSQEAIDRADAVLKRTVPRKRAVDVRVRARLGEPFSVELFCCDDPALRGRAEGFTIEAARTRAVTCDDLIEHVGRMGSTPFEMRSCEVELDEGCGMGFSAVHAIRAEACAALEAAVLAPYDKRTRALTDVRLTSLSPAAPATHRTTDPEMCAIAVTLDAARAAREAGASRIYMAVDDLTAEDMSPESAAREHITPVLDEVSRECDHARLDPWISAGAPVAVGTISELSLASERGAATELRSCIPAHNAACLAFLANAGAHAAWLSPELSLTEIERLAPQSPITLGITVFGKPRVMTSEHCILQVADACIHDCERCSLRRRKLVLHNIDDKLLPVRTDLHGRSHLYDAYALDYTPQLPQLLAAGITRFMVDGTLLESEELAAQVARAHRALDAALAGKRPAPRQKGTSSGCLFAEVE